MYFVYIIQSEKTGTYYVGSTSDMPKRLARHNAGGNISTRNGAPWKIVYSEKVPTKHEAYRREMQIKRYHGGEAFRALLKT